MNNKGFTLVELMIATVIFSVILLSAMAVLLQLGRMYYRGVVTARTQETARRITDEISQQVQFGTEGFNSSTENYGSGTNRMTVRAFCVGAQRYSYAPGVKVNSNVPAGSYSTTGANAYAARHGLWRDTAPTSDCTPVDLRQNLTNGEELLGQNMRTTKDFDLQCPSGKLCTLTVSILYGDNDLLDPAPLNSTRCGNVIGSQWCAAASITTQLFRRLDQAGQ